jgi:thiol-disulfide isomerase/thioredoxin
MKASGRRWRDALWRVAWSALALVATAGAVCATEGLAIDSVPSAPSAPQFRALAANGGSVALADLRGKVVLINFWAVWCLPCIQEMPSLEALQARMRDRPVVVLALNVMDTQDRIGAFLQKNPVHLLIARDVSGKIYRSFGVTGFPTSLILDGQGRIVGRAVGMRNWDSGEAAAYLEGIVQRGESAAGAATSASIGEQP